ncbi:MAG: glycoside hydrolase family 16 protein [Sediminibacterium sp.]|nr:glycoside hydrolase family 16 protein [Sediminibacterium sp.]
MIRIVFFIGIVITCVNNAVHAQVKWFFNKDSVITWYYQEGDEFNGNSINKEYWTDSYGWARTIYANKEQQYYTPYRNHEVNNGTLKLTAVKDSVTARITDWRKDNDSVMMNGKFYAYNRKFFRYKAGMIESRKTFTKGYFECRFKLPEEKGFWPAFWLHGGAPNEEIDIFECKSERPEEVHLDTHCPNRCDYYVNAGFSKRSYGAWVKVKTNFVKGFNVMACEWDADQIRFFLNGECIGVSKVKFEVPKLLTLNIAVPSDDGPFKPGPDPGIVVPSTFEIDYVRVWTKDKASGRNPSLPPVFKPLAEAPVNAVTETQLKKKSKFFYGKKEDHSNNGIQVDWLQHPEGWDVVVLGNTEGEAPQLEIRNQAQQVVLSRSMESVKQVIAKNELADGAYTCVIKWKGKQVTHAFVK